MTSLHFIILVKAKLPSVKAILLHMSESNIAKRVECKKFNRFLLKNDKVCFRKNLGQKLAQKVACEESFKFLCKHFLFARISKNFDSRARIMKVFFLPHSWTEIGLVLPGTVLATFRARNMPA